MNLGAPCQYIPDPFVRKRIQSDIYLQYYQSLVSKERCQNAVVIDGPTDAQCLYPHNSAEMPIAYETFLTAEIMLGARFCSISPIIFF